MITRLYKYKKPIHLFNQPLFRFRVSETSVTYKIRSFFLVSIALLSGCQSTNHYTQQLNQSHYKKHYVSTTGLPVAAWLPKTVTATATLRVYIEGDGHAWAKKNKMSSDPTPKNRLMHALVSKDPKKDTAYIARPCQFITNNTCTPYLWTFSRYDDTVIKTMNDVLEKIKTQHDYKKIELIGFSGGATIALLLASRRNDILSVRTIAGNLDPQYTNRIHRVSKMPTALNPASETDKLQYIPQWHFIGARDRIINASVFSHYLSKFNRTNCIKSTLINNASHHSGWLAAWPELLKLKPSCTPP